MAAVDTAKLKEFVALKKELDDLDISTKNAKAKYDALEPVLRDQFAQAGQQSANIDGVTVFMRRDI